MVRPLVIRDIVTPRSQRRDVLSAVRSISHRHTLSCILCLGFLMMFASAAHARPRGFSGGNHHNGGQHNVPAPRQNQTHLGEWLHNHQNLTPQQQQQALHKEPGFNNLPPQEQQRLQNRLNQLNSMPLQQRQRTIERMEALEKLSPEQRQQVGHVMQQVSQLPMDRQRMVRKAFRDLRDLPPEQRQAILASSQFKGQFSDQERQILGNLMSVEPYMPLDRPGNNIEYGGKQ